jgi:predicted DNA-binding antitoxin AbrB/MazE fold protein
MKSNRGDAMKTVRAIFENGVFRPLEPVELPEGAAVEFELRVSKDRERLLDELYELLSERFDSGEHDVAARHNEHQP